MAFGVALTIASLFADQLALGMPGTGFGWKQLLGTVLGLAVASLGGYALYRTPPEKEVNANDNEDERAGNP